MILLCSANKFQMSWRLICLCKVPKEYIAQVFLYLFQQWLHINYSSVSSEKWKNAVCNSTSSFGFLLCWLGLGAVSEVSGALCKCINVGNAIAFTGIGRVFFGKVLISPSSSEVVHNSRSLWRGGAIAAQSVGEEGFGLILRSMLYLVSLEKPSSSLVASSVFYCLNNELSQKLFSWSCLHLFVNPVNVRVFFRNFRKDLFTTTKLLQAKMVLPHTSDDAKYRPVCR